ncbi:MAG: hypothetical protein UT33_C0007G0013 [Candidatus Peregrinibacteria bacterium GW2011_GWC2_39_14]|nr:MAG: hypothetical protein US92_C0002G0014 [Candidatus Peregrinibacteria bacterium GW2011_GWA2_38_36]KKR06825.1 MAG: hypothetical protein UT33_C0007G0013 [Candidatus Peregrinibacteria bacterium GW2011_GWC2_39_14]
MAEIVETHLAPQAEAFEILDADTVKSYFLAVLLRRVGHQVGCRPRFGEMDLGNKQNRLKVKVIVREVFERVQRNIYSVHAGRLGLDQQKLIIVRIFNSALYACACMLDMTTIAHRIAFDQTREDGIAIMLHLITHVLEEPLALRIFETELK